MDSVGSPRVRDIRHASPPQAHDKISRRQYIALWVFMMGLHALCAAFLLACAKLYWIMENKYLDYFATLLAPARDRHFRVIGTAFGVIGAAHGVQFLNHLGASVIARRLTVRPVNLGSDSLSLVSLVVNSLDRLLIWVIRCWRTSRHRGRRSQSLLSASNRRRDQSYNDETYGRVFAIRKTVEIATQIPNAYLYSTLIARPWINHVKVALLVTNCWSACIIHRMLIKIGPVNRRVAPTVLSTSRQSVRFLAIVMDTLLAIATGMLLPGAIIVPYLLVFDFKNLDFPDSLLYGDTSFANLILENRAFFAISWGNAVMKGVPHVSAFLCLLAIASMLDVATRLEPTNLSPASIPKVVQSQKRTSIAVASYQAVMKASKSVQRAKLVLYVHHVVAPLLFLVAGVVVLTLHLVAQFAPASGNISVINSFCLQRMHPWLAPNVSCAVIKYNCYREGVLSPPFETLGRLERESVRSVIFLHCSEFVMPPIIQEFSFLMGIELWNTTLVRWGEEAALSAKLHPRMIFMFFAFVNLTSLPIGILNTPFPEQLIDLEFVHTNLTTLPNEVTEAWNSVQLVYIEHSQLNQFPVALMTLPVLSELSLIGNKIETMPDDVLLTGASTYFYDLAFSKNPLQKLPEARSEHFFISYLALEFTQLTVIPSWIGTKIWDSVSLGGSPVCETGNVEFPDVVLCGENDDSWDPLGDERYPTQFIEPSRSLNA